MIKYSERLFGDLGEQSENLMLAFLEKKKKRNESIITKQAKLQNFGQ